ncbi:SRPBCC domain-containing protein [Paenibacillus macerans]|uniref:SRPBCC family protein n=1 Tax=Paenibacillus macerans TaxID=44252 RepID=UPI00203ED648|nr:SRPBCC domain-containing protein [Paenibacillus macerans]MCM3702784.1 SRPBCC domain-containing protein [Paenibacillus macerans]
MVSSIFKEEIRKATRRSWEDWVAALEGTVDPGWSHEQVKQAIHEQHHVSEEWGEWIATMYAPLMGRVPVGTTKDAGVQTGVRRSFAASKEGVWEFLTTPAGLPLWIGAVPSFKLEVGYEFASKEGVSGKITVVKPYHKLRLTWKRPEWGQFSRLQLYVLSTNTGKTTVSIHQEMLEDVFIRELMKRHWEDMLAELKWRLEDAL